MRLGLCCLFRDVPVKFSTTTATSVAKLPRQAALAKLGAIALGNARSLREAIRVCGERRIGAFRVLSQILPLRTHPTSGYRVEELPEAEEIVGAFRACGGYAREAGIRLSFHPDQFVVLNSLREDVVRASLAELEYQAEVAEWIGADVVNIHAGGAFGDKPSALARLERGLDQLSSRARSRVTLENDDGLFAPADLLPICHASGTPLCYDVHHHRCFGDELSVEEATAEAIATWNREPLFHVSSPLQGWDGPRPERHHDFVDAADVPEEWVSLEITVDVEAKAKELAVERLARDLGLR